VEITYNGQPRRVAENVTVAELLAPLEIPLRQIAVEVNQELVPRERLSELSLKPGDHIEVVTLAGGG
jgi:thiamine biosynthesis protein ThiS